MAAKKKWRSKGKTDFARWVHYRSRPLRNIYRESFPLAPDIHARYTDEIETCICEVMNCRDITDDISNVLRMITPYPDQSKVVKDIQKLHQKNQLIDKILSIWIGIQQNKLVFACSANKPWIVETETALLDREPMMRALRDSLYNSSLLERVNGNEINNRLRGVGLFGAQGSDDDIWDDSRLITIIDTNWSVWSHLRIQPRGCILREEPLMHYPEDFIGREFIESPILDFLNLYTLNGQNQRIHRCKWNVYMMDFMCHITKDNIVNRLPELVFFSSEPVSYILLNNAYGRNITWKEHKKQLGKFERNLQEWFHVTKVNEGKYCSNHTPMNWNVYKLERDRVPYLDDHVSRINNDAEIGQEEF